MIDIAISTSSTRRNDSEAYSSEGAYSSLKISGSTTGDNTVSNRTGKYMVRQVSVGTTITKTRLANTSLEKFK